MIKAPIQLTAKEGQILHDICLVRRKALQSGEMDSNENQPLPKELTEQTARQVLHIFDFFRSVMSGNAEAVRIQSRNQHDLGSNAGTEDFAGMISNYHAMMVQRMQQGNYAEISDHGRKVILSHYPVFCYKGQYRKDKQGGPLTFMLYGHVHNTQDEALINRFIMETRKTKANSRYANEPEPIPCNMINCFCMFSDYQPMTLDEWIRIDTKRRAELNEKDQ